MKAYTLLCTCLLLRGSCVGPDADSNFELNNADGHYIMTELVDLTKHRGVSMDMANERRQVRVKRIVQSPFDHGDSLFPGRAYFYRFEFADLYGKNSSSIQAACGSVKLNKKNGLETQWLGINDSTGMLVILQMDYSKGFNNLLAMSNIMKSTVYKEELDTIRYVYRPKFN